MSIQPITPPKPTEPTDESKCRHTLFFACVLIVGTRLSESLSGSTRHKGTAISEITIIAASCPFDLSCSLQETDDRIPSFRFAITLTIPHFGGEFKYRASNIWFACKSFDHFLSSLSDVADASDGEAPLADLSDDLNIRITNTDGEYSAQFDICRRDVNYPKSTLSATCMMERESVQYVFSQFKQMPRWW